MGDKGLGGLAKRWLTSKVKEITTADRRTREAAAYDADETARQLRNDATGEAIMTAIPGLRRLRDRQLASAAEAEERRAAEAVAELDARPRARVSLAVDGAVRGSWAGELPTRFELREPAADDDEPNGDPFGDRPTLVVDLRAYEDDDETIDGRRFGGWAFQIPGFEGAGTYDLAASGMIRREAGWEPEYLDWELALGADGEGFFFQPDLGEAIVEIGDVDVDGLPRRVTARLPLVGATGQVTVEAEITVG